jgi:hypothetical protein
MSLSHEKLRGLLKEALSLLSDEAYQRRAWLGVGPEVSSPDEMVNDLLGYLDLKAYVSAEVSRSSLAGETEILLRQLGAYPEDLLLQPRMVLQDPRWEAIRDQSRKVVALL